MFGGLNAGTCGSRIIQAMALAAAIWIAPAHADNLSADGSLELVLDQAKLMKLPERVATIVIGNPLIADAALQAGGLIVLTGKGYGTTNLIALDRRGNALLEKTVLVNGPNLDTVVVYKGINRETYSCAPICQPRNTLGDGEHFFTQTLTQTTTLNAQATGMK